VEKLILASASPRRSELLTRAGIPFEVFVSEVDEHCSLPAAEAVLELSSRKALAVHAGHPSHFILAADTLVAYQQRILGKPKNEEDAVRMLRILSGQTHSVFTGITVLSPKGEVFTGLDHSLVTFCDIPEAEIIRYVQSGEPMDKAGAYAIQGRAGLWVTHLDGCDSSVIGLPLYLVRKLLLEAGYPI